MKPGCFVKGLIVSTIVLALIIYVFTHKFNEFISVPLKNVAADFSFSELTKEIDAIGNSDSADSLKSTFSQYIGYIKNHKNIKVENIVPVADSLKRILSDKVITPDESRNFTEFINKVISNEK